MVLYITEKAAQVKSLNEALKTIYKPSEFKIVALSGHIMKMKNPNEYSNGLTKDWIKDYHDNKIPFQPDSWEKVVVKDKKTLYKNVFEASKVCDEIVLASDPDNEGVVLVMEVLEQLKITDRVIGMINMSKLDITSLKKEIKVLNKIPYNRMYEAGLARSYVDWIYGMNGTVSASVILGNAFKNVESGKGKNSSTLHIGGVKLPVMRMVVERDHIFENFKNIPYWTIKGIGEKDGEEFEISLDNNGETKWDNEDTAKKVLEELKKDMKVKVSKFEEKDKKSGPPKPLSLTDLQSMSSSKFKYSAAQTLKLAQGLYDKKFQSYPRTDNNYYAEGQYLEVDDTMKMIKQINKKYEDIINNKIQTPYLKRDIFNDKKVTAHTGLAPTTILPGGISSQEDKVYKLVLHRYLIQFMDDYEYFAIKGEGNTSVKDINVKFGENISTKLGWKELDSKEQVSEDDNDDNSNDKTNRTIPSMKKGDEFIIKELKTVFGETKPKPRFTESSLVKAMDNISSLYDDPEIKKHLKDGGIGTPATRGNILTELFENGYFEYEGKAKKIKSTEKARILINLLPEEMSNPILRAKMENNLKEILAQNITKEEVQGDTFQFVIDMIKKMEQVARKENIEIQKRAVKVQTSLGCPKCQKGTIETNGKYFKCSEGKWNARTKKVTGCDFVIFPNNKVIDKTLVEDDLEKLFNGEEIKGKNGNSIKLDLNNKYGLASLDKDGKPLKFGGSSGTPDKDGIIEFPRGFKKVISGKEVVLWNPFIGAKVTKEEALKIFEGERILIKKMKSKAGKTFNAYVKLKGDKIELDGFEEKKSKK